MPARPGDFPRALSPLTLALASWWGGVPLSWLLPTSSGPLQQPLIEFISQRAEGMATWERKEKHGFSHPGTSPTSLEFEREMQQLKYASTLKFSKSQFLFTEKEMMCPSLWQDSGAGNYTAASRPRRGGRKNLWLLRKSRCHIGGCCIVSFWTRRHAEDMQAAGIQD